jgi:hypothetical protein
VRTSICNPHIAMAYFGLGFLASLLRTVYAAGEHVLPLFFPPKLEVIDYAYGRLKDHEVDWEHYVLRVGLKFINSSQKPVLVTGVRAYLDDKELEYMGKSAGERHILTSKGWRILDHPREQSVTFPFQVPATNAIDNKFVLFRIPNLTERCFYSVRVQIRASIAWRIAASVALEVKPEPVLPNK